DDAEALIKDAHSAGIKVIVDLVPNHTSWDHEWFVEALAAEPGSPARDRYIFREGKGTNGELPPTNWSSVFGGPAWSRCDDGQWYLHLFDNSQPDLNWHHPEVRAEFCDILRFWIDLGVDGFRVDVAHGLIKDLSFPDLDLASEILTVGHIDNHPHWDRDEVHDVIREWRAVLNEKEAEYDKDLMMVAEAWVKAESVPLYLRPDEYHQSFNFDFIGCPWNVDQMRSSIARALVSAASVNSSATWVLSNHDVLRHPTRFGLPAGTDYQEWLMNGPTELCDRQLGTQRGIAVIMMLLALPGSTYIYQGEELGLHEVPDLPQEVLDDPVWRRSENTRKGRDGCRVPIPWTQTGPSFGFSESAPWLPQPAYFGDQSVEAQDGVDGSVLEFYRSALALRSAHWVESGDLTWLNLDSNAIAFERNGYASITNFGDSNIALPPGEVILTAIHSAHRDQLAPNATVWLRLT
ncbi:MAG: alpha-amylase family glycosyl hydrolase, partial [Actinomycetota bacterium]|nr:alpha-amylase family glycosyl hydrolase [Actinomycetota bacterium]